MASKDIRNPVPLPTIEDLKIINDEYKLGCDELQLGEYQDLIKDLVDDYNALDDLDLLNNHTIKREYQYPNEDENKHKAWYVKCSIKEKHVGKLHGKRIAIKDNTAVAGIPMMNGSRVLEGYIPEYDAIIVKRILDEGGEIIGKTTCEDLCISGASYFTTHGPVTNPYNIEHSAGGSSSGSGVVVATGGVDMAIGGDQGGSVRIPASNCGIVGLKATHGLIPYTGAVPILPCIDHLGPMAKTVADCALMLEVIAGFSDGFDYRQRPCDVFEYTKLIYPHVKPNRKLKVGILQEGVELCDQDVQDVFNKATHRLTQCEHLDISTANLASHKTASSTYMPLLVTGCFESMIKGCGYGTGLSGYQSHTLVKKMFDGYKEHGHEMSPTLKLITFLGNHNMTKNGTYHYAKSATAIALLRQEYNKLLTKYDVIIMPTLSKTPCKIPPKDAPMKEKVGKALDMVQNTAIFNATGHPALSLNCGYHDKLPVGLMIIGKHYDEVNVLTTASIFEENLK